MRRFMTFAASLMLALAMLIAPDMRAQSRRSGGGSTTTQQNSSRSSGSSSSTRSSGSSVSNSSVSRSSSGSASRSSGSSSAVQQDNRRRNNSGSTTSGSSSGSVSRSSGNSSSSGGSISTVQQDTRRRNNSGTGTSGSSVSRSGGSTSTGNVQSQDNNRRRNSGSATSGSSSSSRSGGVSSDNGSTVRRSSNGSSSQARSSSGNGGAIRSVTESNGPQNNNGSVRTSNVTRSGLTGTAVNDHGNGQDAYRDPGYNYRYNDGMRVDDQHNMYRVPPRQREPMAWDRPGYFWGDHPHYYGYRIHTPPPSWRRISHWGIDYYYYNGIYYRPFGGAYVICRPPFGTPLERAIDRAILRAIRFSYYYDTYRTYESAFDYYNVIARQNLIIAQQNARIIAQNSNYAINSNRALTAYELATKLGLVQSYAYANAEYFYQDGVFYTVSASGVYSTIVPPAGALVTSLPDDYEIIVLNGIEYYMVDNTVYRTTVFEGEPYLEVLGQMYGSLYNQYNIYR